MMTRKKTKRKISTRLLRKGPLVEETYTAFAQWDLTQSIRSNLHDIKGKNVVGAGNEKWLKEITRTLSSRFTHEEDLIPLVILARGGCDLETWKPCLLWHIGNTDALYYQFATRWLFDAYRAGGYSLRSGDVVPFVRKITDGRIASGGKLTDNGARTAANDLLRMATVFGLLSGRTQRQFESFHLSDECFLYILHAIKDSEPNARRIVQSSDWRIFLMESSDVERELFRLHQYRKLEYEVAGSLAQLNPPCRSLIEYAKEMAA